MMSMARGDRNSFNNAGETEMSQELDNMDIGEPVRRENSRRVASKVPAGYDDTTSEYEGSTHSESEETTTRE